MKRNKGKFAVLAIGAAGLVFGGSAVAGASGAERTHGPEAAASATTRDPAAVTLKYADRAVLPLARKLVRALKNARPSRKQVTRRTSQMNGASHRKVTNVTVIVPAKGRLKAEYRYAADFRGRIRPKNVVTISIFSEPTPLGRGAYAFSLAKTKFDNPGSDLYNDMHWIMYTSYALRTRFVDRVYDSCSAKGLLGGGFPIMSKQILAAGIRQSSGVLRRAVKRKRLKPQGNVFAGLKPAKRCG